MKRIHYAGWLDDFTACKRNVYLSPIGVDGLPRVSAGWDEVDCLACWRKAYGHRPLMPGERAALEADLQHGPSQQARDAHNINVARRMDR